MAEAAEKTTKKQSCENHEKCMEMIQAVLDGSASKEEVEHFKLNMDECIPCIEGYNLEKSIKNSLQNKIEKKCCPQTTIELLKSKIGMATIILLATLLSFDSLFN